MGGAAEVDPGYPEPTIDSMEPATGAYGTTVTIHLPAMAAKADALSPVRRRKTRHSQGKRVIMIVDDEAEELATIEAMVRKLGHDVVTATDGPNALEIFDRKLQIDLLLVDMVMTKGMSGLDVARALQAKQPGLPVIFRSGYSDNVIVRRSVADRSETLLTKPFQRAVLLDCIRGLLAGDSA